MRAIQDPSFTPQRSTSLESCWPCLPKRIVIGFDRCRSFLRITPDFLIAYLIHSSPTSVHTPSHILSLSPWIPPRAIVHSKSVSASEPSVVYHSLYGQRQTRLINNRITSRCYARHLTDSSSNRYCTIPSAVTPWFLSKQDRGAGGARLKPIDQTIIRRCARVP